MALVETASGDIYEDGLPALGAGIPNDVWSTLIRGGLNVAQNVGLARVNAKALNTTQQNQIELARVNPWGTGTLYTASPSGYVPPAYNPLFPTAQTYPQAAGKTMFDSFSAGGMFGILAIVGVVLVLVAALFRR
jgi:hypothetical protein